MPISLASETRYRPLINLPICTTLLRRHVVFWDEEGSKHGSHGTQLITVLLVTVSSNEKRFSRALNVHYFTRRSDLLVITILMKMENCLHDASCTYFTIVYCPSKNSITLFLHLSTIRRSVSLICTFKLVVWIEEKRHIGATFCFLFSSHH